MIDYVVWEWALANKSIILAATIYKPPLYDDNIDLDIFALPIQTKTLDETTIGNNRYSLGN